MEGYGDGPSPYGLFWEIFSNRVDIHCVRYPQASITLVNSPIESNKRRAPVKF